MATDFIVHDVRFGVIKTTGKRYLACLFDVGLHSVSQDIERDSRAG
jgi:hypothetical protein